MNILITGATGNIGLELIGQLIPIGVDHRVIAAVRNIEKAKRDYGILKDIECRLFDFEDTSTHQAAFQNIDIVFLLRPPHISKIKKVFEPIFLSLESSGVRRIVFLSVQGAEKSEIIPHRKIERLILKFNMEYIFVRPSYFMQNLTTTLSREIREKRSITLPASNAKFNWIDIKDIAIICTEYLVNFSNHKNRSYVISGPRNLSFPEVVSRMNAIAKTTIAYRSVGPIGFFLRMRTLGMETGMIVVMFILHFLPRIQGETEIVDTFATTLRRAPRDIDEFIEDNKGSFI